MLCVNVYLRACDVCATCVCMCVRVYVRARVMRAMIANSMRARVYY
jgi:hypothetical protein